MSLSLTTEEPRILDASTTAVETINLLASIFAVEETLHTPDVADVLCAADKIGDIAGLRAHDGGRNADADRDGSGDIIRDINSVGPGDTNGHGLGHTLGGADLHGDIHLDELLDGSADGHDLGNALRNLTVKGTGTSTCTAYGSCTSYWTSYLTGTGTRTSTGTSTSL